MTKSKTKYKYAVIATDTVLFTIDNKQLKILLIKMNKKPFQGSWAVPGGLAKANESVKAAGRRNLKEKAGVNQVYTEQLYTFGQVNRDPFGRVVSVAYLGLAADSKIKIKTTAEHKEIKWFDVKALPKLAYDHRKIITTALDRLRSKLEYTNIAFKLLPNEFTMSDLQKAYEIIRGKRLDKRNFQKKIFVLDLVKKLNKKEIGQAYRPAQLYTAKNKEVVNVNII
ncbi:NUDIX hydrolase [bacterium]|nr:NUDIX hydrolase [bacterium]